jgi:hypothetical protein
VAARAGRIRDSRPGARDSRAGSPDSLPAPARSAQAAAPTPAEPGLMPAAGPRRRRLAPAGLAAGLLAAGLLGWLLATAQAGPGPGGSAQARSIPPASTLASPHQQATPARSGAPARTSASTPAPSASPADADPAAPAAGPAAGGKKVAPGRAKHDKGPPPGHR